MHTGETIMTEDKKTPATPGATQQRNDNRQGQGAPNPAGMSKRPGESSKPTMPGRSDSKKDDQTGDEGCGCSESSAKGRSAESRVGDDEDVDGMGGGSSRSRKPDSSRPGHPDSPKK
jgi:hypothetical protein